MTDLIKQIESRFTSLNSVPVPDIRLSRAEWHELRQMKTVSTPIEQLMAEYEQEHCDWSNVDYLIQCGYRYANVNDDSHWRCLALAMARKLEELSQQGDAK